MYNIKRYIYIIFKYGVYLTKYSIFKAYLIKPPYGMLRLGDGGVRLMVKGKFVISPETGKFCTFLKGLQVTFKILMSLA